MYKIIFTNEIEIRMGSPYNIADIEVEGDSFPVQLLTHLLLTTLLKT